ncbi:MAG: hypothetical protein WC623_23965 [Pedobacter sp.]|uniref:hypothetical protein n=1 Tax=Pedobacter sp. TaxID=1411316 RepID=UPI003566253D
MVIDNNPYQVDGEVGRFTFRTHSIKRDGKIDYTTKSIFPNIGNSEWYKTSGFKEIAMIYGTAEESYRKTAGLINRIRYQENATPVRTLGENTETEGAKILDFVEKKTTKILLENNFTEEGSPKNRFEKSIKKPILIPQEEVKKVIAECGLLPEEIVEIEKNPVPYESPNETVNISIDDVLTKKQKEKRSSKENIVEESEGKKYIHNTVVHIHKDGKSYIINGYGVSKVLRILIGFLLNNDQLKYRLQFFVDGQKTLQAGILKAFSWFGNIGLILDWYHLEEKCKMQLSMAMKGRDIRNEVLAKLKQLLWYGMIDNAIEYVRLLNKDSIKDSGQLEVLIKYIERNRPYIPCYAIRKKFGLRNSSNIGEKMNDLVISGRQKHNGMSWSTDGSVALACVTTIKRNKEYEKWFEEGNLEWKLAA